MNIVFPHGLGDGEEFRDNDEIGVYKPDDTPDPVTGSLTKKKPWLDVKNEVNLDGVKLGGDRYSIKELESETITTGSGYYTIAKTTAIGFKSAIADFVCSYGVGSLSSHIEFTGNGVVKDTTNNTLNITGSSGVRNATSRPTKFREVKSDTVSGAGAKLQVYLDITTNLKLLTGMFNATGEDGIAWALVEPVLENTPLCPDGVTVGTFIEVQEKSGTKIEIWSGSLNSTGVTETLISGESFLPWDYISIYINPLSDSSGGKKDSIRLPIEKFINSTSMIFVTPTGYIEVRRLTATTFDIAVKTSTVGNVFSIYGEKL